MKAYIFPGQGSQFVGMGKDLYENNPEAKLLFEKANSILGFSITDLMFSGTDEDLKQTKVTQPAIFIHSLTFEDALVLVSKRAMAMQKACELNPSTMAAILNLEDAVVERICSEITAEGHTVVAANYNCPGQLVISGSNEGVNIACERLKAAGAKRALLLPVGGAFHSPLMEPARIELETAINNTNFSTPRCPIYQNVNAQSNSSPDQIKQNLIAQLTAPVKWTQTVENMIRDGVNSFVEVGPGKVLQGLVKKVNKDIEAVSA